MAKRGKAEEAAWPSRRPSALIDTRVIYCGDRLDPQGGLPDGCVDLIYIDSPFNTNRNGEASRRVACGNAALLRLAEAQKGTR